MSASLLRTDKEITGIYERHKFTVYRICFAYMKNPADTEDVAQDVFFQLIKTNPSFENEKHEKAWLIRTAANLCKNRLRHWWHKHEDLDDYENLKGNDNIEVDEIFSAIMGLPEKYKTVVYLYYYEGYDSAEISKIISKPPSTIRNHLHEARRILRDKLGGDFYEG